jgi:YVTN family beta-propeller protein
MAITPDGTKVYVANDNYVGTVSVIDMATNQITDTIPVGINPVAVAVAYV